MNSEDERFGVQAPSSFRVRPLLQRCQLRREDDGTRIRFERFLTWLS